LRHGQHSPVWSAFESIADIRRRHSAGDKAAGDDAPWIHTCSIITGEPNDLVAPIHNRMPVILPPETWARWLGEEPAERDEQLAMPRPYPAERMRVYPTSARVNSVKNDDGGLLEPMMAEGATRV
jgi:putative SOS response-associated peptidase YedK